MGTFYVSDTGNCLIRKISAEGKTLHASIGNFIVVLYHIRWILQLINCTRPHSVLGWVTTWVGDADKVATGSGYRGYRDGMGTAAKFNAPMGITVDLVGQVYVADSGNNVIRMISPLGTVLLANCVLSVALQAMNSLF